MFSLIFKKCAVRFQTREFATILINSMNRINRKVIKHFTNINCAGLINRDDRTYYRPFSSTMDEFTYLPPLMNIPLYKFPTMQSFIKRIIFTSKFRTVVDNTFNIEEFTAGSLHAITTISQALAAKDYEQLNGLVDEPVIEMLKKRVDLLTTEQKELIPVTDKNLFYYYNYDMDIRNPKDALGKRCENLIEVSLLGYYSRESDVDFTDRQNFSKTAINAIGRKVIHVLMFNYTFQRCYYNDVGGPWIATVVNHFTITS
nr:uncharacterized protein LOC117218967 isoform X2 [Megalopta genalis]